VPSLAREHELLEDIWTVIRDLLPPKPAHPKGGRPFEDDFLCFVGIVFVLRNGARWRALDQVEGVP
jgi:transposase